jgi:PAS domain S-box-containing protein
MKGLKKSHNPTKILFLNKKLMGPYPTNSKDNPEMNATAPEITEHKRFEELLENVARHWRNTFDSIPSFVSVHDKEFKFVRVNKKLADFVKAKPKELIGRYCYEIFHGTEGPLPNCPHTKMLKSKETVTLEIDDPHIGCPLQVTVSPIFDGNSEIIAGVHIAEDISVRKQTEKALQKAHDELEMRVKERTSELVKANKHCREAEKKLRIRARELQESNTALKVLLKQRENDKKECEENILSNVKHLILPYIEKLKKNRSMSRELAYLNILDILESNLKTIVSPYFIPIVIQALKFYSKRDSGSQSRKRGNTG